MPILPCVQYHHRPRHADRPFPDDRAHHGHGRSLAQKKIIPLSAGTFPVSGFTFVVLLLGTVLLVGALNFLPCLTLGPIVEHFQTFWENSIDGFTLSPYDAETSFSV